MKRFGKLSGTMKDSQEKSLSIVTPKELKALGIPIVDDSGKEIVRPDVLLVVTQLASLAQIVKIRKSLEREHIEGRLDEKTLNATDKPEYINLLEEYPYTPYATASLYNNGPDSVKLSINNTYDWSELAKDESLEIDFTKADRRIEIILYRCNLGKTASITVKAKY